MQPSVTPHQNGSPSARAGLVAWLLWFALMLGAAAFDACGQSFPTLHRHRDGRAFVLPNSRSRDTSWLKVGDEPVFIEKAAAPWPSKWLPLSERINFNEQAGTANIQGLPADGELIRWRYWVDDRGPLSAVWQMPLPAGKHRVRIEYSSPGYATQTRTVEFTMPGGAPPGAAPTPPKPPATGGGAVVPKPKPDENRLGYRTDENEFAQPANSRLRRVPRLLLPPLTKTVDPDFGSIPAFDPPSGLLTVYQDAGDVTEARSRGWRVFHQHGLPGEVNLIMLYNGIFEDADPTKGTKFRRGIGDAAEIPDLIARAKNAVGGWRGPDGKFPKLIAVDWEIEVQPGQTEQFYRNRGAIIQALRAAFPGSLVGHYGGMPMPGFDGPTDFHMVGDYVILNLWDGKRHFDACENPALWSACYDVYAEWAFQKYNEGRKALKTRAEGKGLLAYWNLMRDGCEVPGRMSTREDIAEGALLTGILSGMEGVWPWNAHCGPGKTCERLPQVLTGTRALTAALWRLSQPGVRELLDGNQTYFFPEVSTNGMAYTPQPDEFKPGAKPPAYASLRAPNGDEAIWSYHWPDELPVVVGIRNRGRVALAAVLPRANDGLVRQFWVRGPDFADTFTLRGRNTELFYTL